ncbi:MAG TPA: monofunctional biosynthetic peptidoglycan transglycosylase [Vicinamibacterales bacterium]|nr:monofunctional biosynthetic peptidoglycan transglycosylase [Vicinamibacterales bacterium]
MRRGWILRGLTIAAAVAFAVVAYAYLTLPDVRDLATTNPQTTAFMTLREAEAASEGRKLRHLHQWVRYSRISKNLQRAVLVAEDSRFFEHEGVDLEELKKSIEINIERGGAIRGGSTITQQLAKNLYLSPSKNPIRKLRELIITRRIEAALSKARILEIYLNVIEWGDGIWGAEAAARNYFGVSAAGLSREQAALLAGAIINPRVLNPAHPNRRLLARQRIILGRMGAVEPPAPVPTPAQDVTKDQLNADPDSTAPDTEELPPSPPSDQIPPVLPAPSPEEVVPSPLAH